jgi:hypothetical protein
MGEKAAGEQFMGDACGRMPPDYDPVLRAHCRL